MFMKKITFTLFLLTIVAQSMFAWGWAARDASNQSSENPTYYLGDQVTLYWYVNSTGYGATYKKAGIGTTNSSGGMNWQNVTWQNDAGDGYGNNEGIKSATFTVNSVSTWYYSLWLGWGASIGDNGAYNKGSSAWTEGNTVFQSSSFTVSALSDPTSQTATAASITQLNLSWSKWNSKNVMIVRKLTSAGASNAPTQGTAYTVGNTLGTGTVVYNSGGTSFNDTGLTPGTSYTYIFYSENYSYYSPGATAVASTNTQTSAATDYFKSKATGNWSTAGTWESSPNNTNWITSTLVPGTSATAITILSGHNVTLDTNATISGLVINSGATFTASDATPRTLTISKSTSGSATTLANNSGSWANGSGSTVVFSGAPSSGDAVHAVTGTIGFQNITINKTGGSSNVGASFGASSSVSGTLEIGYGGYVSTAPPTSFYVATAILKFNQGSGASYDVGSSDNSWSTSQIPNYITISSGTVNLNSNRTATGNLLIDGGALVLKNANSTNLTINGNWTRTSGTFTANDGTITLSGTTDGIVNVTGGATMTNLVVAKTTGAKAIIDCNLTTSTLTINSNAILTANAGKKLTVSTTLTNNGTLNLLSTVDGTATILTPSSITGTGAYSVQQYLTSGRNWYVSSPVSAATSSTITSATGNTMLGYLESNASWPAAGTNLDIMKGYIVSSPSTNVSINFTGGTLNTGDKSIILRRQGATKVGFNLVGNPYPAYVNVRTAIRNTTNLEKSIWYRTKTGGTYYFDTYNVTSGFGTNNNGFGAVIGTIPPMQAFWVRANADNVTLSLNNSLCTHKTDTINPFKAPAQINTEQQIVRLQVSNGTNSDEAVVIYNANASNGYDDYDSPKMTNNDVAIPEIYTIAGTEQVVINGLNSVTLDEQMPLGFTTGSTNTFTIKATELTNFDADKRLILLDTQENTYQDLTYGSTYTFSSTPTTSSTRFKIVFKSAGVIAGLNNNANNSVIISTNENKQILINRGTELNNDGIVTVYNAVGQKLVSSTLSNSHIILSKPFNSGVYVVCVNIAGTNTTKKVIIK